MFFRASTIIKYIAPLMLCLASINDALPNDISPTYGTSPAETARPKCRPRPASKPKCHRRQRRPLKYNTDNTRKVSLKSDTRPQQKPPQQKPPVEVVRPPPQRQLPTPGASLASVDPDLSSMEKQYLDAHNQYRARHRNTGALKWSDRIKQTAQRVANTCKFEHSGTPGVGENIAWGTFNPSTIAKDTTKMYYDEIRHYTPWFGREPRGEFSTYGHFTQVIWAGTTELGCAHANVSVSFFAH